MLSIPYNSARYESIGSEPLGTPCDPVHTHFISSVLIMKLEAPVLESGRTEASETAIALPFEIC